MFRFPPSYTLEKIEGKFRGKICLFPEFAHDFSQCRTHTKYSGEKAFFEKSKTFP